MKKIVLWMALVLFLGGCSGANTALEQGMQLRTALQQAQRCSFDAEITADYGNATYTFTLQCAADGKGNLDFTVLQPQTISGITGRIDAQGGKLTFDDAVLCFDLLADGQTSPVSAPWVVMKTLLGGYLTSAGEEDGCVRLTMDDSFQDKPLTVDVWLDERKLPKRGEILYDGRRILTVLVENFEIS